MQFIYLIRDNKSGLYSTIHFSPNDDTARRQFRYDFRDYPFRADLELYRVGQFDPESGQITLIPGGPQFLETFHDLPKESLNNG